MYRKLFLLLLIFNAAVATQAQRFTDKLDRGLVAVVPKNGSGIFLSWRIQAEEYYDVTYNVYRNGVKLNSTPLSVSNYTDASGNASYKYTVKAVVNGVEQPASKAAKVFKTNPYTERGYAGAPAYLSIPMKDVVDRNGNVIYSADGSICTWDYTLNDASLADLDGDGEVEIIIKRINATDAATAYPNGTAKQMYEVSNTTAYTIFEAYKLDGTRLWWIDCGPNLVSLNSTELNCVAYDWDMDGKAEVLMRGADNMIIHKADGTVFNVGNMSVNTRNEMNSHTNAQYAWTKTGAEYLLYLDGATAAPFNNKVIDFPIARESAGAWGDDSYGHRSSKFFFGAPFLDGRKASIFLARGIYQRIKMVALDVDANHNLTVRAGWPWECNTKGSVWYGQGNHNMTIADVDGDGCDEIVYGSMTIDNNGKGLSSTGLGHGDAMHVSDLDPFRKGMEVFACNEEKPANNFRNATTSEIYYRSIATGDDGRALMGNFVDAYPGCEGRSVTSGVISSATSGLISDYAGADDFINWGWLNGRIYWDGDLCEEYVNSPGIEREGVVAKVGVGRIMQTSGVAMTNDSKNNPCAQGDILGDWREELILRCYNNKELRIYTTTDPTTYRIPSLWYDHEYRQAMVWQVCAYNQPPHASFFLGKLEGITKAPVPLTNTGRTEINKNGVITSSHNGAAVMLCDAGNYGVAADGASPSMLVVNASSVVSGSSPSSGTGGISTSYNSIQLGATISSTNYKGDLTGAMHLVKQGDGLLKMTARTFSYTGDTEVWAGSLYFRGTFENSNVWMNRHTEFFCGANIKKSLTMEYGSTLYPSKDKVSAADVEYNTAKIGTLNMHEGSRIVFQMSETESDAVEVGTLNIRKQDWKYGPEYLAPVFEIQPSVKLADGKYKIGSVTTIGSGSLDDIILECSNLKNASSELQLVTEGADLYFVVGKYAAPGDAEIAWEDAFVLDFEETSTNNYGFTSTGSGIAQKEISSASHCLNIYSNKQNGDRVVNLSFANNPAFTGSKNYKFEFDYDVSASNESGHNIITTIESSLGTLLTITTGPWSASSVVASANGSEICTITTTGYIKDVTAGSDYCPTGFSHFVIEGNDEGVTLTITKGDTKYVENQKLSNDFAYITNIKNNMARGNAHIAFDNIILLEKKVTAPLSDIIQPIFAGGFYNTVDISRSLIAGYNTLCVPFSTTPEALAGPDTKAYTLASITDDNGVYSLRFSPVKEIEANMPYLLYVPSATNIPDFSDITVSAPVSESVNVDGWKFVSNYTPGLNMKGNYIVAGNQLRIGGASAFLNGMRAYIVAPASANVKAISISYDEADGLEIVSNGNMKEEIYNVSGILQSSMKKGINIVRTKDGQVKKVFVK